MVKNEKVENKTKRREPPNKIMRRNSNQAAQTPSVRMPNQIAKKRTNVEITRASKPRYECIKRK
jgi:hypothetical protein